MTGASKTFSISSQEEIQCRARSALISKFRKILRKHGVTYSSVVGVLISNPVWREPFQINYKWVDSTSCSHNFTWLAEVRQRLLDKIDKTKPTSQVIIEDSVCLVLAVQADKVRFEHACLIEFLVWAPGSVLSSVPTDLLKQADEFYAIAFPRSDVHFLTDVT